MCLLLLLVAVAPSLLRAALQPAARDPPLQLTRRSPLPPPLHTSHPPSCSYVGLSPYSAPAVFGLLAGTELTDGVWYPRGGFQTVRCAVLCMLRCAVLR